MRGFINHGLPRGFPLRMEIPVLPTVITSLYLAPFKHLNMLYLSSYRKHIHCVIFIHSSYISVSIPVRWLRRCTSLRTQRHRWTFLPKRASGSLRTSLTILLGSEAWLIQMMLSGRCTKCTHVVFQSRNKL